MISMYFWKRIEVESYISYLILVLVSNITIFLDIILLPSEIVAFLLHRLLEGEWREDVEYRIEKCN